MSKAIEHIASGYVRLKDRVALEQMREHRNKLLQEYRMRPADWLRSEALETALREDVQVLNDALSRLTSESE
jgi:hypothetical protein